LRDDAVQAIYAELETEARRWLAGQNVDIEEVQLVRSADLCYSGQSFEINVVFPREPVSVAAIESWFHDRYERVYGYDDRPAPVRTLEARVQIVGITAKPDFAGLKPFAGTRSTATTAKRKIYEQGREFDATIKQRAALEPGTVFEGPAVVEQYDTTVY